MGGKGIILHLKSPQIQVNIAIFWVFPLVIFVGFCKGNRNSRPLPVVINLYLVKILLFFNLSLKTGTWLIHGG